MPTNDAERVYLWLDFETTGSRRVSPVIEVGWALTTADLEILTFDDGLIKLPSTFHMTNIHPVVQQMHTDNGLWDDLNDPDSYVFPNEASCDNYISEFAKQTLRNNGLEEAEVTLAGSGVSHFDSPILKARFPETWNLLKGFEDSDFLKPTFDIGVMRRFLLHSVGITMPTPDGLALLNLLDKQAKPHRALYDVFVAIDQARWLRDHLKEITSRAKEA